MVFLAGNPRVENGITNAINIVSLLKFAQNNAL